MEEGARELDPAIARRFEVLGLAGTGGMGSVYRARELSSDRVVALKLLPAAGDSLRFTREANVLALLEHARIVRYLDHGVTGHGTHFLVMEWLDGVDLAARLREGPLGVDDAIAVARAIGEALVSAHASGIVHRDLKPANVFLVERHADRAKLIDFGLARPHAHTSVTVSGVVVGTPAYMAPEQIRGDDLDERVDVYGLGTVLYACLTGHAPFQGAHQIAVLAKVTLEPAPSVRALRAEVPPALDALVARMLAKDRNDRPHDVAAVLRELDDVERGAAIARTIARGEQRVACIVLCSSLAGPEAQTIVAKGAGATSSGGLEALVEAAFGTVHPLTRDDVLVTIRGAKTPAEQALRAARSAIALSQARPDSPVVVATGRVILDGVPQVGEVIDRAAEALHAARAQKLTGVRVDERTAELLGDSFELRGDGAFRELLGHREPPAALHSGASCVGRGRELASLEASLRACVEDEQAQAVLVTAPAGMGKSCLLAELLSRVEPTFEVRIARGDAFRAGSPFGIVASLAGEDDGARLHSVLRDLAAEGGTRADPTTVSDAVREAFVEWIGHRLDAAPLLLAVEDLHWVDTASLRLLDAALAAHGDRAFLFVGTARPDERASLQAIFRQRGFQELSLGPLPRRAAESLVRERLAQASDDEVRALVDRAGGHPFYLEELVRAVARGLATDALPETVLGMIQARLDDLGVEARRTLRAASLFGDRFGAKGVAAVVGATEEDVARKLASLVSLEIVAKSVDGFAFRHALIRDAAYASFTDDDRALGHRLVADFLAAHGERDPAVLAEHRWLGGDRAAALPLLLRAAKQALDASDLDRAAAHVARARECDPDAPSAEQVLGPLFAIEAEIGYWRGDLDRAVEHASAANLRLDDGSIEWFSAAAAAIGAHGQRGQNDDVARWLARVIDAPRSDATRGAHATAVCRGLTQLLWAHHERAEPLRRELDEIVPDHATLDPFARGWVERVRAEAAWLFDGDVDAALAQFSACCDSFASARATRYLVLARLNTASLAGWAGDRDRAAELLAPAWRDIERLGSPFLVAYHRAVDGMLRVFAGDRSAYALQRALVPSLAGSPRLAFVNHVFVAHGALESGELAVAEEHARAAMAQPVVAELRPAGVSMLSRVLLARGAKGDALARAREACAIARRHDFELFDGLPELAMIEALDASGQREQARSFCEWACARIERVASTMADARARERLRARCFVNDRLRALATAWG